jgi:mRNA-degrading endonuclease toxin of MazEF toxin-antitoxin module
VNEVNVAPVLPVQPDVTIAEGTTLLVTNTATDSDIPTNTLSYALLNPPTGAQISDRGVISWTPTHEQAPSTNIFETVATDNGVPSMSATNSFKVFVTATQTVSPPIIQSIAVADGVATISWSSITGRTYRLLYNLDLSTNWIPIPPDITASNSSISATDSVQSVATRFYRVQLLP